MWIEMPVFFSRRFQLRWQAGFARAFKAGYPLSQWLMAMYHPSFGHMLEQQPTNPMMHSYPCISLMCLIATALFCGGALGKPESKFGKCKARLDSILNGTETYNGISNETVHQYIYDGPIGGMKYDYAQRSRDQFIAITTDGCEVICDDPIDWYWESDPSTTLGIISNWILPIIALLAALPYDSGQGGHPLRNALRTMSELVNWLGSPQTALTATFFNIHQMLKCLEAAKQTSGADQALQRDAYYVLCCVGQFELPADTDCFLDALTYGLFKPLHVDPASVPVEYNDIATCWTEELLRAMAHQMRRSRRRGVWSTFASIFLFFVAFAVSVVLAFGDLGERTTTHSLAFGLLITWFPLLLLFSILDRNPNSAERTRWAPNHVMLESHVDKCLETLSYAGCGT
jgi:hypothetical protein